MPSQEAELYSRTEFRQIAENVTERLAPIASKLEASVGELETTARNAHLWSTARSSALAEMTNRLQTIRMLDIATGFLEAMAADPTEYSPVDSHPPTAESAP
jgi:hypothetical protein